MIEYSTTIMLCLAVYLLEQTRPSVAGQGCGCFGEQIKGKLCCMLHVSRSVGLLISLSLMKQ
jgi:hypothetical protein